MLKLGCVALFVVFVPALACAQDDQLVLPGTESAPSAWTWFGDVLLREDHVRDIPRIYEPNIQRVFERGRLGVLYDPIPQLEIGGAIKVAAASNANDEDRVYNLNERSNDIAIDQLFVRWRPNDDTTLLAGKSVFPLELSPMLWDEDLRPLGVSAQTSWTVGSFDRLGLVAGYFNGNLPYGDNSRIGAVQGTWRWHEGEPTSAVILVSYLDFSNLRQLTLQGLARTNVHTGDVLLSAYRLLDAQLVGRWHLGNWPLEARLDRVRNLGADQDRDGTRFSVVLGDRRQPRSWEFGLADQRIQRDAVMAAFNSDEWWFHSWAHGIMPWVGYGFDATWNMRLAVFHEELDEATRHTATVLLDLNARW
ncbi:MAG: putative porin [Xanthomonadaceae bacterium]|nr:putative porin [Xanthomonadaceae bacterium]